MRGGCKGDRDAVGVGVEVGVSMAYEHKIFVTCISLHSPFLYSNPLVLVTDDFIRRGVMRVGDGDEGRDAEGL